VPVETHYVPGAGHCEAYFFDRAGFCARATRFFSEHVGPPLPDTGESLPDAGASLPGAGASPEGGDRAAAGQNGQAPSETLRPLPALS
jgi:hypothetical protein